MRVLLASKAMVTQAYLSRAEAIARQDPSIDLTVVVPSFWREPRAGTLRLEVANPRGYRLVVLPLAFNGHHHVFFFRGLSKVLERCAPDVFHIDEEPFNLATYLAAKAGRARTRAMLFYSWANIKKPLPPPFSLFRRTVYSLCRGALVGSQEAAKLLADTGYNGMVEVVPQFGVDLSLFPFKERRLEPPYRVGYMGRLVPEKGVDLLLTAVAGSWLPWEVVIVGAGEAEAALRSLAVRVGLQGRVRFCPPVPSREVGRMMGELHVLVLPSRTTPRWKEQFGRVLVEAMATGCVVIGSSSGEIPNVIGSAGVIFPEGDAAALRDALEQVVSSPSLYLELAHLGRDRASRLFSQDAVAARHAEFYHRLAGL